MAITKTELRQIIDADADAHIMFLQALIRAPSPNPPGDTRAAVLVVQSFLQAVPDLTTKLIAPLNHAPNLVSTVYGSWPSLASTAAPSIVLNGHIDQFPVSDETLWTRPPYSGDVIDGFVHGRSGVDMKAGTAASVIAFRYLHRFRDQLTGRATLEVVSDEETGGRWGTRYLLEDERAAAEGELWRGDVALIAEPGGLESIRFGEKGTLRMDFTVTAPGGHGAYLHRNEGAIRIANRLITRLVQDLEQPRAEHGMDPALAAYLARPDVQVTTDEIMGPGAARAMLIPTLNIGTISGGSSINMIPSLCTFSVDIRLPLGVARAAIEAHITAHILPQFPTASYSVRDTHSHASTYSDREHRLVELLQANVAQAGDGAPPVPICSLGATDAKHFRTSDVPAFVYGVGPKGMAERDEMVSVAEFLRVVKVHTLTAWDFLGGAA